MTTSIPADYRFATQKGGSMTRFTAIIFTLVLLTLSAAHAEPLPGVDVKGLDADELTALTALMKDGACICAPAKSMLVCIQEKSCPSATELASYGAAQFREGLGAEQVRDAVVRKYMNDYVTYTFDLTGSPKKGAEKGKVTIVEFADFECPHCSIMSHILTKIAKAYPKDVTIYYKVFPLGHPTSEPAARAALAAGLQGRFWPMHDLVFANQGRLSDARFLELATELGLDITKFKADMVSPTITAQIKRDRLEGINANITGTPTLYINGKMYLDDKSLDGLSAHIKSLTK